MSELVNSGDLSNSELTELHDVRSQLYLKTQLEYVKASFNPESLGTILFMSLGTGSAGLQSTAAKFSPKFASSSAKVWSSISSQAPNVAGRSEERRVGKECR